MVAPRGHLGLQLTLLATCDRWKDPEPFPQPPVIAQDPMASSAGVTCVAHDLDKPGLSLYSL